MMYVINKLHTTSDVQIPVICEGGYAEFSYISCSVGTGEPGKNSQNDSKRGFKKSNLFEQEQANGPKKPRATGPTGIIVG
jgi:hypothetical protein